MNYRRSLVWAVFIFSVKEREKKKQKRVLIFFQFAYPKTQNISWYKRTLKHMPPCSGDHWSSTQAYWCYSESKVWICSASWIRFISAQHKLFQLTTAHVVISFFKKTRISSRLPLLSMWFLPSAGRYFMLSIENAQITWS